jgi:hypothetical protein
MISLKSLLGEQYPEWSRGRAKFGKGSPYNDEPDFDTDTNNNGYPDTGERTSTGATGLTVTTKPIKDFRLQIALKTMEMPVRRISAGKYLVSCEAAAYDEVEQLVNTVLHAEQIPATITRN